MVVKNYLVVAFPFQNHFTLDHILTSKIFLFLTFSNPPKVTSNLSYNASFHGSLYESTSVISKFFKASFSLHLHSFATNAKDLQYFTTFQNLEEKKIILLPKLCHAIYCIQIFKVSHIHSKNASQICIEIKDKKKGNDQKHCSSLYSHTTQWLSPSTFHLPWGIKPI